MNTIIPAPLNVRVIGLSEADLDVKKVVIGPFFASGIFELERILAKK